MAQRYRHRTPPEAAIYNRGRLAKLEQTSVYRWIDAIYCRAECGDDLQWPTTVTVPPKGSDDSDSGIRPMRWPQFRQD